MNISKLLIYNVVVNGYHSSFRVFIMDVIKGLHPTLCSLYLHELTSHTETKRWQLDISRMLLHSKQDGVVGPDRNDDLLRIRHSRAFHFR